MSRRFVARCNKSLGELPSVEIQARGIAPLYAALVASHGWPTETDTKIFLAAGYGQQQILEVVLGVGLKTLSNYTNHIAETPLDEAFTKAG